MAGHAKIMGAVPSNRVSALRTWLPALGLLALGAAVRALRFGAPIAFAWSRGDEPRLAILGIEILQGVFPIHQLGYEYHGSAPAYPLAVLFALLGPTPLALDLGAFGVGLAVLGTGYLLARRILPRRAALLALTTLAVPPLFLAQWSLHGNLNHPLNIAVGNLLLLGTHTLFFRTPARPRTVLGLGLLTGLGWWINPLIIVYVGPLAFLALTRGLWRRPSLLLLFVAGTGLGGLPAWLYETFAFPSSRFFVYQHGDADMPPFWARVAWISRDVLPRLLGVEPRELTLSAGLLGLGVLALGVTVLLRAIVRDGRAMSPKGAGSDGAALGVLLWPVFLVNLALVLGTPRGVHGNQYLLPLYSVLPCWTGETLSWLWQTRPMVGRFATILLLSFHLGTNWMASLGSTPRAAWRWRPLEAEIAPLLSWLDTRGLRDVYWIYSDPMLTSQEFTFLTRGRIVAVDPWSEDSTFNSTRVDAAIAPAWIGRSESPGLADGMRGLGLAVDEVRVGGLGVLAAQPVDAVAYEAIPPQRWQLSARERSEEARNLADRDIATGWTTGGPQTPGQWVAADLGTEESVARVDLLTVDWQQVPSGLRVEVSRDGARWQVVSDIPHYWGPLFLSEHHAFLKARRGRVQAIFPPARARFVRLVQTGTSTHEWEARELMIYRRMEPPRVSPPLPAGTLSDALRRHRVRFVYADAWLSARVLVESRGTIDAQDSNLNGNAYGRESPSPDRRFRAEPGRALVLGADADLPGIRAALQGQAVHWQETTIGPYGLILFTGRAAPLSPLAGGRWRAVGTADPVAAPPAFDAGPRPPRTSTRGGDAAVLVDLGSIRRVAGVSLWPGHFNGQAIDLRLEGSIDGTAWVPLEPLAWAGRTVWTGSELLRDGSKGWTVRFPQASLRYLRLTPTGVVPGGWKIRDLFALE
jgi:hypothetical protein